MLIDKLWEVQELQLDYRRKEHLLQESDLSSSLSHKIDETQEHLGTLRSQLEGFKADEAKIGAKLDDLSAKVHEAGAKLGKEEMSEDKVQKLEEKMKKLTLEKEKIEDAQGKNFHDRQDIEDQIRAAEMLAEKLRKELATIPQSDEASRAAVKKSLPTLRKEIESRKSKLPLKAKLIFESLSEKFSGAPISRVASSTCDYCHVRLSQKTLFSLRNAGTGDGDAEELIRCEICGKILYAGTKDRE
ncbi:MAG: zinc ribbon domain-containing protein [Candidatus Cryosericum sp.]